MEAEPVKVKNQTGGTHPLVYFLMGLLLLLPALKVGYDTRLQPALYTANISMTKYNMIGDPKFIGTDNYARLGEDRTVAQGLQFGMSLVLTRLFILAIVPPAAGLLAGAGNWLARSINRLLLSVITGLTIPIGLILLWRIYHGPMWGMEPSPIFDPDHSLASANGARDLVLLLDALVMLGTGGAAGITVFMAVMRGRSLSRSITGAGIAVWLLIMLFGFITLAHTFTIPGILTGGGPGNATITPGLVNFNQGFRNLNMGYAAAHSMLIIVAVLVAVLLIWVVLEFSRLRVTLVPYRGGSPVGLVALPLMLLMALPLVGLVMWGRNLATVDGYRTLQEQIGTASLFNTATAPWLAIWLTQLPVTWLAGFALGFIRPGGRIVSSLLFLLLLLMLAIPDELLYIGWYNQARDAGILNTTRALTTPWLISVLPFLAFKLFFDGAHEKYQAAVQGGARPQSVLIAQVILPSLLLVLVAGAVLSFQSIQDYNWSLIVINQRENMPLTVQLVQLASQYTINNDIVTAGAIQLIMQAAAIFIPIFIVLHLVVLDRFALIAGKSSTVKNEAVAVDNGDIF